MSFYSRLRAGACACLYLNILWSSTAVPAPPSPGAADYEERGTSKVAIGFVQTIDWHDKRSARAQSAKTELAAAQARLQALRLTKATELLQAMAGLQSNEQIMRLVERLVAILERFTALAEQRHKAGDIPLVDLQLARLSLTEVVLERARRGAALISAGQDFFALSGREPDQAAALPQTLLSGPGNPSADSDDRLATNHPDVQAAHLQAQAARQQIRAVDRDRRPDPTLGVAGGKDEGQNLLAISFSVPLQLRNDFGSTVDAARAEALQNEQEAQQVYRTTRARLGAARQRYRLVAGAWSVWSAQGQPGLQRRVALLERLWKAGELGTTDYLLQIRQTLDTRIAGAELQGDRWQAWIEWLAASGRLFNALEEITGTSPNSPAAAGAGP